MQEERINDGKKTMKSIILNIIVSIITIIVSLAVIPIITNLMSTSDVGIATTFATFKNIFTIICLLAIDKAIDRIILESKNDYEDLSSLLIVSTISSIVIFMIYLLISKLVNPILGFDTKMMSLMFGMIILINGATIYTTYCNYKNKYKVTVIHNILSSPVSQILSLILVYLLLSEKYLGRIIGLEFYNVIAGIVFSIYILYKGKFKFNRNVVKTALLISIPLIPHMLSQVLLSNSDLLMINKMVGSSEAGIYSIAYTISNILYFMLLQLLRPWSSWVYRRIKNNEIDSIKNNSSVLISIAALFAVGLFTIAPDAISIFLNNDYLPARIIIAPICVGILFQIMYILFYDVEYYHKKNKQIAIFSCIAAVLNIILNYIFIQKYGYYAAAYTTLVSYFILTLLHYVGMKKIDKREIYDIKFFTLISLIVFIISMVSIKFIDNFIIRYALLIIFMIYLYLCERKEIKGFIALFLNRNKK